MPPRLLYRCALVAPVLAFVRLDVLLIQTVAQRKRRQLLSGFLGSSLCQGVDAKAEIQERLNRMRGVVAVLTGCGCLHLAVERLMDDTVARMLAPALRPLAIAVSLVKFLGQKLEELVGILFLGCHEVFKRLLLGNPEPRQYVGGCITVGAFQCVKILEHVVHSTA